MYCNENKIILEEFACPQTRQTWSYHSSTLQIVCVCRTTAHVKVSGTYCIGSTKKNRRLCLMCFINIFTLQRIRYVKSDITTENQFSHAKLMASFRITFQCNSKFLYDQNAFSAKYIPKNTRRTIVSKWYLVSDKKTFFFLKYQAVS